MKKNKLWRRLEMVEPGDVFVENFDEGNDEISICLFTFYDGNDYPGAVALRKGKITASTSLYLDGDKRL